MTLYLYTKGEAKPRLTLENVLSYTDSVVVTTEGVYGPLAEDCELSSKVDCSETLRADWRAAHPSDKTRIEELEALMAELLFGDESE